MLYHWATVLPLSTGSPLTHSTQCQSSPGNIPYFLSFSTGSLPPLTFYVGPLAQSNMAMFCYVLYVLEHAQSSSSHFTHLSEARISVAFCPTRNAFHSQPYWSPCWLPWLWQFWHQPFSALLWFSVGSKKQNSKCQGWFKKEKQIDRRTDPVDSSPASSPWDHLLFLLCLPSGG